MPRRLLILLSLLAAVAPPLPAYPPAPAFTIYGSVRSETGRPLATGEGTIILSNSGGELARGPSDATLGRGINYTLQIPMDSFTDGTLYKPGAQLPDAGFAITVVIGTKTYVPLAVAGRDIDTGQPGDRQRLDLVLGIDSDGDGLPDAWEQALIDANPNDNLRTLADITPGGDADGDGLTNYQEFIDGTYGLDAASGLFLDILGVSDNIAHLQLLVSRGRTYTIRTSADLRSWTETTFSLDPTGASPGSYYVADDSRLVDIYVPVTPGQKGRFFKMYVE